MGKRIALAALFFLFGFIYKRSNSLWSVIILHSLYNLLVSLFY
ncbi:type II CAAX prenyl endopeptidase Rce1 family protein [Evansella sp. AB-rgal1]